MDDALHRSTLRSKQFERILLIKPSALGDVIHTVPVLVKLRARYPTARIDWLLTPPIAELIRHHPALSNVLLFARRASAAPGWLSLLARIWRNRYDLVIDLHGQFRSALFTLVSGAPTRIGFDRPRRETSRATLRHLPEEAYLHGWTGAREGAWVAYSDRIPIPTLDVHAVDRYLWLEPMLGLDQDPPDFRIPISPPARTHIDTLLKRHGLLGEEFIVLVPGTIWETKHWTVEGFAAVANSLSRSGRAVVLAGSAKERARCREVTRVCPQAFDLSGQTTVSQLAALIERSALCVTNDSGSMHLTVALGKPVVSIFGPTDPVWIGPYGRPHAVVRAGVPCSPCYLRKLRSCPNGHGCMKEVTPEMVMERVEYILSSLESSCLRSGKLSAPEVQNRELIRDGNSCCQ
jgi:lipopolysaccharide heptosyltransferase I